MKYPCIFYRFFLKSNKWPKKVSYAFIPLVSLYVCLAEWLATNVDPCAATSGGNLSMVLAFWATFSLISGWLLRCCLQPFPLNGVAKYALLYCFPSLCLWIASQATFRFFYGIEGLLENLAIWPWIYEVQCYNESEPKTIVVAVVMGIIFYSLVVAGLFCLSRIKQR